MSYNLFQASWKRGKAELLVRQDRQSKPARHEKLDILKFCC